MIEQNKVNPAKKVVHYLPEMEGSAFEDATVQQVVNMTTAIEFAEGKI